MIRYLVLPFLFLNIFNSFAVCQTDSSAYERNKLDSLFKEIRSVDSLEMERNRFDSLNAAKNDSLDLYSSDDNPSVLPVTYGIAGFLYLFNPIVLLENDKIVSGITKEISVGFGDFGQNRLAFEYSFLFRETSKSHYRFSVKHDFLLKKDLVPSNLLQTTPVVSIGGGYFTDLTHGGVFPELSYGFSIRNNKLLIYPHVKVRYTFIFGPSNEKSDIVDISLGFMLGFANPFIDNKIRRRY